MLNTVPIRSVREKQSVPPGVMQMLLELWEDNPTHFELLAGALSRQGRPIFGSVTVMFAKGAISQVDKKEILKPAR